MVQIQSFEDIYGSVYSLAVRHDSKGFQQNMVSGEVSSRGKSVLPQYGKNA